MKQKGSQNNFLVHGGILALASVLVRLIGMIYRIPMVRIIGREGSGYYSTAFSVYNILLLLSSYSLPLAVSKMVSARVALKKWRETERVVLVAVIFAVAVGLAFGLLTFFGADFFCTKVMNSPMAAIALKWMAPTIFIMAVLGVLRGFFQGLQTTIPTAISQILEQIVNAFVSVGMAFVLFNYGQELAFSENGGSYAAAWGAAGGTIGTGAGALAALIFLSVLFFLYGRTLRSHAARDRHVKIRRYGRLFTILTLTAVPVILSTAAYNCIDIIDNAVFNGAMRGAGYTLQEYSGVWGDYNNAYLLLIHLPVALASAIAAALVPSLTAAFVEKDAKTVLERVDLTVRVSLLIAIPCSFGMIVIGGNLAKLLFGNISAEAERYLVFGGLAVIFFSLSTVTNAILQGLNHLERPVIHAFISLLVHAGVLVLLIYVFHLEIYAVIIAYMIFGLLMCVLNMISIYRLTGYAPEPVKTLVLPVISALAMVIVCFFVSFIVSRFLSGNLMHLLIVLIGFVLGVLIYAFGVLFTGCLDRETLLAFPFGTKLAALADKLHLLNGRKK